MRTLKHKVDVGGKAWAGEGWNMTGLSRQGSRNPKMIGSQTCIDFVTKT